MEVHFTAEEEIRLQQVAARSGRPVASVVNDTVWRALEDESRFVDGVQKGLRSSERGDLLEHDEVVARIEARFGQ